MVDLSQDRGFGDHDQSGRATPRSTLRQRSDGAATDSEFSSKFSLEHATLRVAASDFGRLRRRKSCAIRQFAGMHPVFVASVRHVVVMSAEEQVDWADTSPDVAVVADEQAIGNRPEMHFIGQSVSFFHRAAEGHLPVTPWVFRRCPEPARLGLIDLGPKSDSYRLPTARRPAIFSAAVKPIAATALAVCPCTISTHRRLPPVVSALRQLALRGGHLHLNYTVIGGGE